MIRRLLTLVVLTAALAGAALATGITPASADSPSVSRKDAIAKVQEVRGSIDRTLALIKAGQSEQAFEEAKDGYLNHFELVEIPLRVADNSLTIHAESLFAEIRTMIRNDDPEGEIRDKIVELRGVMDDVERKLTSTGLTAPALVLGQSFLIIFREGFEVILLLSVLLGYLEAAKSRQYMRPILAGVGIAAIATVLTVLLFRTIFAALPVGQEMLEAITALVAVAMLFYVSFWLIARLEHKRWLEFVKARMWSAVSVGSGALADDRRLHRGLPRGLRDRALLPSAASRSAPASASTSSPGSSSASPRSRSSSWLMFRLGRRLPIKTFMNIAVVLVMATSVAFLGNAVHALQAADRVPFTPLAGWPRPPIFLSEATGYWPTVQTVTAQIVLTAIYVMGGIYVFLVKPRLAKRRRRHLARSRRPPLRRRVQRARWQSASGSTSEERSRRPWPSTSRSGIVAESVLPTTHDAEEGVAAGVVQCVADVAAAGGRRSGRARHPLHDPGGERAARGRRGHGRHRRDGTPSRARQGPQAHRAVEGRAQRRASTSRRGRCSSTSPTGWTCQRPRRALRELRDDGVSAIATAEAFAPDDASNETRVAAMAAELGLPSCASTDLSGLVRARAARGDGGDQRVDHADRAAHREPRRGGRRRRRHRRADHGHAGRRRSDRPRRVQGRHRPRTLYSGPAASVSGALRYTGVRDGIVVEVGGTSTNVAGVKLGRPSLSYVTVASHATALRARRRAGDRRRRWLDAASAAREGVGCRAALARTSPGCPTPASPTPRCSRAREPVTIVPRAGDPDDYLVLELTDGRASPSRITCAANALSTSPTPTTTAGPIPRRPGSRSTAPDAMSASPATSSHGGCSGRAARPCASS